ncbi:hypothetical protein [Aestuariibaculum lutulentum]|uniref:Transmembrane protein n=1 Tax=Aestuariibaculum lutulentum TaxID=2920935 RepID=A0ABS9RHH0_9FLAO|nr:hypothetical protein [Aestuariibaculum lutulentum]MCH4552381.1 hypothetical protein [Aestuariibaculum lutulentum]
MKKYISSSSKFISEAATACIMILLIGYFLFRGLDLMFLKVISLSVVVLMIVWVVIYSRKKAFNIYFEQEEICIKYTFIDREIKVQYNDLIEVKYISGYRVPTKNSIKFIKGSKLQAVKFDTVGDDECYLSFVKYLKSKNKNIELKVIPSDHILNYKLQEIYGFKYRKFVKETL